MLGILAKGQKSSTLQQNYPPGHLPGRQDPDALMQQGTGEYAVRIYLNFILDHAHSPAPTTPLDR